MRRSIRMAWTLAGGIAATGMGFLAAEKPEHPSALFKEYCAKCHGEDGKGQTPKGKQLKARDFTDEEWQSSKSDRDLIKTVAKGGEDMPAFGKKLTREQIESLVKEDVRGFKRSNQSSVFSYRSGSYSH